MKKHSFWIALVIITFLNILQSITTELIQDEAYYWMYSIFLDWGYFDHPPLVAVYIFFSDVFFSNELGVRFISTISYSLIIYLVWKLIESPKKEDHKNLYLLTILSTAMLNIYGFITVPDTPLLLFMTLYLTAYKSVIKSNHWSGYVLLSVSMSGLLYSKYTGVLIIIFTILSNLSLLKNKRFWFSAIATLLLFTPHLVWQYSNDYPSIRYHLFERSNSRTYKLSYTIMHLVNQIAIIGFTFPIMYFALFKNLKNKNLFQKSLNFIITGFISFFFIMSFKGPTQAQWTIPISIPLVIITFLYLVNNKRSRKLFRTLAIINLFIICLARIVMANEGLIPVELEMHGNKKWVQNIKKKTPNQKKLFLNSYQNASLYSFYSKDLTGAYNSFESRKNQFNLWDFQTPISNKNILLIANHKKENNAFVFDKKSNGKLYGTYLNKFTPVRDIKISYNKDYILRSGQNSLKISINNPYKQKTNLNNLDVRIAFMSKKNLIIHNEKANFNTSFKTEPFNTAEKIYLNFNLSDKVDLNKISHFDFVLRNNSKMAYQKAN
jgi:hypothetical protein